MSNFSAAKRKLLQTRLKGLGGPDMDTADQPVRREDASAACPLSFSQESIWFVQQLEPDLPVYNMPRAFKLHGELNIPVLQHALQEVLNRHESLRTGIELVDGVPLQVVRGGSAMEIPVVDLRPAKQADGPVELHERLLEETQRRFDLSRDLLLRCCLFRLDQDEHVLLLVTHHIASDHWSGNLLLKELSELYSAFLQGEASPLPDLMIQYADFAIWQRQRLRGESLKALTSYWREQLEGASMVLDLPTDRIRPKALTYQGVYVGRRLSLELTGALKALSRRENCSLFMTLFAALNVLLYRYTDQGDILLGVPVAGRNRTAVDRLIGCFIDTLVLRTTFSGTSTFKELLANVRQNSLEAYARQEMPFELLIKEIQPERYPNRTPFFQVMFDYLNTHPEQLELPGLRVAPLDLRNYVALYDLTLYAVEEAQGLNLTLEYNANLFEASTAERMLAHFENLLMEIVERPEERIRELPLLSREMRRQVLFEWNRTQKDFPNDRCAHQLFEAQACKSPEALAVVCEAQSLTYGELNSRADQLAGHLRALGIGPERRVGVCMERSVDVIVGLLGVLKAGGVYVPIDPASPQGRLAYILRDAAPEVILTHKHWVERLAPCAATLVCMDTGWETIASESRQAVAGDLSSLNLAYVIYTSGSTGEPKGVMISHRSLTNHLTWFQRRFRLDETDKGLLLAPLSFDVSICEMLAPLVCGSQLVIPRPGSSGDIAYLIDTILEKQITLIQVVPVLLQALLQEPLFRSCSSIRQVISGGEEFPGELAARFYEISDASLYNLYGPTENNIDALYWPVPGRVDLPVAPIGFPVDNVQVYILDGNLQPVPVGVPGELHLAGEGLARGYLNAPELTAERFIPNPFAHTAAQHGSRLYKTGDKARYLPDGSVEFLGRLDDQVKIRGFRIELGEIEAALRAHPSVRQAVVLLRRDQAEEKRLAAYLVSEAEDNFGAPGLQAYLKTRLPEYMLPSSYTFLESLPLNTSGKVDRRALLELEPDRSTGPENFALPRTPLEKVVTGIWAEVLGVDQVGIHDNFFDLGGHSLLAIKLTARVQEVFDLNMLSLGMIFEAPAVEAYCGKLLQASGNPARVERMADLVLKLTELTEDEANSWLQDKFSTDNI